AWAGACLGIAFCLRYQYAPAMAAVALAQHRLDRERWKFLALGGLAVVLPVLGGLDWLTWGAPFHSVWMNFARNSLQGISSAIGTEPASFYFAYLAHSAWPLPLVACLAVIGATRVPALGVAALAVLATHMLVPHKEVRFIYLTLAAVPILAGIGFVALVRLVELRARCTVLPSAAPVALLLAAGLSWHNATAELAPRWQFQRASTQSFLAAHRQPDLCGLGVDDIDLVYSGGYTYLNRDVPLYFARFVATLTLPDSSVAMRTAVLRHGQAVDQAPGSSFDAATGRFNYLIADAGSGRPGYTPIACFSDASRIAGAAPLCLFRRPGTCG
ncbi:MAG: hypothetical protein AB7F35_28505, partial [Acetobacteraceae bacterium]